jgi:hypothetical protein
MCAYGTLFVFTTITHLLTHSLICSLTHSLTHSLTAQIYQQGEGPVNTVGAFTGKMATLKRPLREWGVLQGEAPNAVVLNWNKEPSPVVHQLDRFQ